MGKKTLTGKVTVQKDDFDTLTSLAKEGIVSRRTIKELKSDNDFLNRRIWSMQGTINRLHEQIKELNEKCQIYLEALQRFPDKVKAFFDELLKPKEKPQEKYEPTPWDVQIPERKTRKSKGGWER